MFVYLCVCVFVCLYVCVYMCVGVFVCLYARGGSWTDDRKQSEARQPPIGHPPVIRH